jgi:hypothetical protein
MSHPESVRSILELAEADAPLAKVPTGKHDELTYSEAKRLVSVSKSVQCSWTRCKTIRVKATDLRPGHLIQFQPEDTNYLKVEQVEHVGCVGRPHTVIVRGYGVELLYTWKADVIVFDGPPPEPVYSEAKLCLLPDGKVALAEFRIIDKQSDRDSQRVPPADEPGRWLTVSEAERITGVNKGTIARAVDAGTLKSNDLKDRERRVDAVDLARWALERAGKPEAPESEAAVERLFKKHARD